MVFKGVLAIGALEVFLQPWEIIFRSLGEQRTVTGLLYIVFTLYWCTFTNQDLFILSIIEIQNKGGRHRYSEMGQLTLASGGLHRNWPDSANGNFWDGTMLSFGKSPPIVPGPMVLINHLPPRIEQGKKHRAAACFPRPAKSHLLFNLSNLPQPLSHLSSSGLLKEQPVPLALRYQVCFWLTVLRHPTDSGTSTKPYKVGFLDEICHFPPRSDMQRSSAVGSQGGTPELLSAPVPSNWSSVSGAWFQLPSCQLERMPASFLKGMGHVLSSPAAPVQPQRTKANIHPALTPNLKCREVLQQGLSLQQARKSFWNSPECSGENAGKIPCYLPLLKGNFFVLCISLNSPLGLSDK